MNLSAAAGKATFHREEHDRKPSPTAKPPSPTAHFPPHPKQSPASPAPSPPVCQNSSQHLGSSTPIPVPSPARLSQQIRDGTGSPLRSGTKKRSTSADSSQVFRFRQIKNSLLLCCWFECLKKKTLTFLILKIYTVCSYTHIFLKAILLPSPTTFFCSFNITILDRRIQGQKKNHFISI